MNVFGLDAQPASMCLIFGILFAHGVMHESMALSTVSTITLSDGEIVLASAVIAPNDQYAYFGTETAPGRVVKIRLSDFNCLPSPQGRTAYFETFYDSRTKNLKF